MQQTTHYLRTLGSIVALAVAATACDSTVTRPSVTFMAPLASSPATGTSYKYAQQPITLAITNAVRVSDATTTYTLEVATDTAFASKVFTREGIAEGAGGTTSVTLSTLDGAKTYYWRSKATIGGTTGEASPVRSFSVGPRVTIDKPALSSPSNATTQYSNPTLTVTNAVRTGPVTTMTYNFQLSTSSSFASIAEQANVTEGTTTTSWTPTISMSETTYYWRVRVTDAGSGEVSAFSDTGNFAKRNGINLNTVNYILGPDISAWPQTVTILSASHEGDRLCINGTNDNWPRTAFFGDPATQVEGNQWNFIQINNQWYGGAGHWYRPNQECKGEVDGVYFIEGFLGREPFASFRPTSGMIWGVGLSTPARLWPSMKTLDRRSNMVLITWD